MKALVYVAALAPDTDEIIGELTKDYPTEVFNHVEMADGFIWMTKDGIQKHFASDVPEAKSELIYYKQGPAAAGLFGEKVASPAWKEKKSCYIVAKNDEAISPELQRIMSKRMGAEVTELATSHVPMISQPNEVLSVIRQAIISAGS
nr:MULTISPECIES: alpha/beta fold hydrolase [unclassified Chryseobacterium]